MASLNKVLLIGNLGKEPELKTIPNGKSVCSFSIATTEKWTSNGQRQEKTEWHIIESWGIIAENCAKYLHKGSSVYVEGKIQNESWEKDGIKKSRIKIVAEKVQFMDKKGTESDCNTGDNHAPVDNQNLPF